MHLKSYLDIDRICDTAYTQGGSQKFHAQLDDQFKQKLKVLQDKQKQETYRESLPDSVKNNLKQDSVSSNNMGARQHSLYVDNFHASPRFLTRMQKQIFLKRKMATDATPDMHMKTHFKGGTSILMNNEGQAKLSLNLKESQEGPCHQLEQLIQYKKQRNRMKFLTPNRLTLSIEGKTNVGQNLQSSGLIQNSLFAPSQC